MEHHSDSELINKALDFIEYIAIMIEILAVVIIVVGISRATYLYLVKWRHGGIENGTQLYRVRLGKTLLIGLEVLVAGDIVRTVALDPTMENVLVLGLLVLIRTFLSWSLSVEIEQRWPWQRLSGSELEL